MVTGPRKSSRIPACPMALRIDASTDDAAFRRCGLRKAPNHESAAKRLDIDD